MERLLTTVSCILQEAKPKGVITEDWVSPFGRSAGSDRARLYHDVAAGEILEGLFSQEGGDEREYHTLERVRRRCRGASRADRVERRRNHDRW